VAMEYRIDPTRMARRSSRTVLAAATVIVVTFAVIVVGLAIGGPANVDLAVGAPSASVPAPVVADVAPPDVRCHDVPSRRCAQLAHAVMDAIVDPVLPRVTTVDVWASIMCGSTSDCPPGELTSRRPAGSARVAFESPLVLLVNVSETTDDPAHGPVDPGLHAWVIRSAR
jgi:hypothetical protein